MLASCPAGASGAGLSCGHVRRGRGLRGVTFYPLSGGSGVGGSFVGTLSPMSLRRDSFRWQ